MDSLSSAPPRALPLLRAKVRKVQSRAAKRSILPHEPDAFFLVGSKRISNERAQNNSFAHETHFRRSHNVLAVSFASRPICNVQPCDLGGRSMFAGCERLQPFANQQSRRQEIRSVRNVQAQTTFGTHLRIILKPPDPSGHVNVCKLSPLLHGGALHGWVQQSGTLTTL